MAFNDDETSAADGSPIELYKFTGTFQSWFLTSRRSGFTNTEATWEATAISRGSIEYATQEEQNVTLSVSLPFNHEIVTKYAFLEAPPSLNLEVYRVHPANPDDAVLQWTGEVISWQVEGRVATMKVPTLFNYVLSNPCPAVKYQAPCNHILYDGRCGVSDALFRADQTIVAVNGNQIELDASPFTDGDCDGGEMIKNNGERRMIVSNVGVNFVLSSPFADLQVSDTVTLRQGCDHTFTTCKNKFNNGDRFGGFPLVPDSNPYENL